MAINDDVVYEVNDKGERVLVRSTDCLKIAYLRYTNRTSRPIDVWWRDFEGKKRHYIRLDAGSYYDVNTYLTHAWEFTDVSTKESFVIDNKPIFRAPEYVGGKLYRTNWNITVMVRPLRRLAIMALGTLLQSPEDAFMLDLPLTLAMELAELVLTLHTVPIIVRTED
ncbi:von Hippel-Lindau protein [Anticarsia gemmatalis]|uniref:von Hippel-Lindau protein n=1 Tax=Anticarsia gemmatalis TaxID=129554 RepID=UPI003F75CB35